MVYIKERKFCFSCQTERNVEDGANVLRGKTNRWICRVCAARKNVSVYQGKGKANV